MVSKGFSFPTQSNLTVRRMMDFLRSYLGVNTIFFARKVGDNLSLDYVSGGNPKLPEQLIIDWDNSCCDLLTRGLAPAIAPDISSSPYRYADKFAGFEASAFAGAAVYDEENTLVGVLSVLDSKTCNPSFDHCLPVLEMCAHIIGVLHASSKFFESQTELVEELSERAFTDDLTGLLNRNGWESAVAETTSQGVRINNYLGVFVLDLDNLKRINDIEGHAAGDRALACTADVLLQVFGNHDAESTSEPTRSVVARTGGDEFSVMTCLCDDERAAVLAQRVLGILGESGVSVSIGYSCSRSRSKILNLIQNADEAMYLAKRSGVKQTA